MQNLLKLTAFFVLASTVHAAALDCSKAKTPQDKALCADPKAAAADAAMSKAYVALAARSSEADKKALILSQRLWLRDRANACADAQGEKMAQCLIDQSLAREHFLEGLPEAGPGTGGKLTPVFIQQAGRKGYYEIDVAVLKYTPPTNAAEKLFNAEIDKALKDLPSGKNDEFGRDMIYSFMVRARMVYASPKLISAHIETYQNAGGAHGNGGTSDINIDAASGKLLTFGDVFAAGAAEKINAECERQILKEKAVRMEGEKIEGNDLKDLKKSIADGIARMDDWSFAPKGATVEYDAYVLGSYAEGAYACSFPTSFLKPLVKSSFALP
ncbi:MAG: lysozyme inhibitor LprI family protein [Methylovirgula sp.]